MIYRFGECVLDTERLELTRCGDPVAAEPLVYRLIVYLIENRDRVVGKDELIEKVWGRRIISDGALNTCVNGARASLGDDGKTQAIIKTFPRLGFRFAAELAASETETVAASAAPDLPPDKPSIAVMPFDDLSAEKDQEYFADGLVEDVITGLSRFKWLFVIARASTAIFRGRAIDPINVGRELGVRYILEGSVRKAGNRVRITTVLVDAASGSQVWAEKYDGALDDIFDLQDEITASVIGAVEPSLRQAEIDRARRVRPDSLDAYDLYLRALPLAYANTPEDGQKALELLEKALEFDPTFASAHGMAAWCHEQLFNRMSAPDENRSGALKHAAAAIAHGSNDPTALCMAGFAIALVSKDYDAAIKAIDRSLALNQSFANAYAFSSLLRAFSGDYDTAIEHGQKAIRLSPLDPMGGQPYISLACTYLPLERYEEAADAAAMAIQLNPRFSYPRGLYVIALVKLGRIEAAREAAARLLELIPFKTCMISKILLDPEVGADWEATLRQAGIPD